jgi:hypothetical protein
VAPDFQIIARNAGTGEVMSEVNEATLEQRVADLEAGYKDLAFEFTDNIIKRIEQVRDEVNAALSEILKDAALVDAESRARIEKIVADAQVKLSADVIADQIIPELTSGRHVIVTRPASFEENRSGKGIPVKQAPHKG